MIRDCDIDCKRPSASLRDQSESFRELRRVYSSDRDQVREFPNLLETTNTSGIVVSHNTTVRIDRTEWKEVESSEYAFLFAESSRVRRISFSILYVCILIRRVCRSVDTSILF